MKSCLTNRERIALLAMDALEIQRERELRAHLDHCASCRRYLEEITSVAGRLRAARPESGGQPSASFHRNLMGALAKVEGESAGEKLLARIRPIWDWRLALPAATAAALLIAALVVMRPRGSIPIPMPARLPVRPVAAAPLKADLEPTFANYEMAFHQSLEKLDELLTEQGKSNPEPSPVYTAARLSRSNMADWN
jgi:hypothetical protein